jgi:hypothetical protein
MIVSHDIKKILFIIVFITYYLVWATELLLAAIGLIFLALVLGYSLFIVESMTYKFLSLHETIAKILATVCFK